jgi:hypothetical protein
VFEARWAKRRPSGGPRRPAGLDGRRPLRHAAGSSEPLRLDAGQLGRRVRGAGSHAVRSRAVSTRVSQTWLRTKPSNGKFARAVSLAKRMPSSPRAWARVEGLQHGYRYLKVLRRVPRWVDTPERIAARPEQPDSAQCPSRCRSVILPTSRAPSRARSSAPPSNRRGSSSTARVRYSPRRIPERYGALRWCRSSAVRGGAAQGTGLQPMLHCGWPRTVSLMG